MTPDRIVVGEVRGGEALALLDAYMTSRVSQNPQQSTIGRAVNLIIYLKYLGNRRIVEGIIEVAGYDAAPKNYKIRRLV